MTRYRGCIGINRAFVETDPGTFVPDVAELEVVGEIRNSGASWAKHDQGEGVRVSHILSIVTPEDRMIEFNEAVWVEWQGHRWAVTSIRYIRPRAEFALGGRYND